MSTGLFCLLTSSTAFCSGHGQEGEIFSEKLEKITSTDQKRIKQGLLVTLEERAVFKLWTCMSKAQQDLDSANCK